MSATTHAIAAYTITVLLLWGYAVSLWLSTRQRRASGKQRNAGSVRSAS